MVIVCACGGAFIHDHVDGSREYMKCLGCGKMVYHEHSQDASFGEVW